MMLVSMNGHGLSSELSLCDSAAKCTTTSVSATSGSTSPASATFPSTNRTWSPRSATPTRVSRDPRARIAGGTPRRAFSKGATTSRCAPRPRSRSATASGSSCRSRRPGSRPRCVRRPRRGSPARLPVAEARSPLAAARGGDPRDGHDRIAARRGAARRRRDRSLVPRSWSARSCSACVLAVVAYSRRLRCGRALAAARALVILYYILVWENGLARAVTEPLASRSRATHKSLVAAKADVAVSWADRGTGASIVTPILRGRCGARARRDPLPPGRDRLSRP